MVIKVKEITIGRGRKWAWNFGNSVGFNVSITIEGTTVKDTIEDMIKRALSELIPMQEKEQERCRDVYDIAELQEGMEFKESLEKAKETTASGHPVEKLVVVEEKTIVTEAVIMTPEGVTVIMKTPKSLLVTKKGFQKWIAFSLMEDITEESYEIGEFIEVLTIKEDKRVWFNEVKGWDKLEVRKR